MNYEALDEALEVIEYIEEKSLSQIMIDKTLSNPLQVKVQVARAIKIYKDKLAEMKTDEEKKAFLIKEKAKNKKGMTWRQNQRITPAAKKLIEKEYNKLFKFIDDELAKLK